ncbi:MAG: GAF and ANTAR domain-containing protein [Candidatus Omnitrophica bacterium]|nr:GAF and ANTAR domain-containing protein [Candidatus Omnitrophota bacterium]MCM8808652.1 GAF and ANTAR domain-containing protein [Candidatus Omnitrophota bacterium]MCM8810419.1 GAF and ANTAR domain-containing protein [Candidatus Omnitrophota bacterium]
MKKSNINKEIEALYKISSAITSDMYIEDILKLIVNVTAEVFKSKICSIFLYDEKEKVLKIRATQAMSEEYLKKPPLKIGEGITGKVFETKKPMIVEDVRKEKEYKFRDIAIKEGLVSMLSVPMIVKNKTIGVLNVYTTHPYKFTEKEIEIISSIANQAAIVIENTELLVKTKILEEELEARKKIEKAKGILMKEENLSEEQAYNKIRKYSMNRRISMKEVAEAIILTYEIKKGK